MRVKIRLYRPHDMDLIALKRSESYKLGTEMKRCLIAYANGSVYTPPEFDFKQEPGGYVGKSYQMHIELNSKKPEEAEAIKMLQEIRAGYRCAFVKTLFRSNCIFLPLLVFSDSNGLVTSKAESFYNFMRQATSNHAAISTVETNNKREEEESKDLEPTIESEKVQSEPVVMNQPANDTNQTDGGTEEFDSLFASLSTLA